MLDEVKEGIINAYQMKTGLPRQQLSDMMDAETWLSAKKAVEMGFADKIMFEDEGKPDNAVSLSFSRMSVTNSLLSQIKAAPPKDARIILPTMTKADAPATHQEMEPQPVPVAAEISPDPDYPKDSPAKPDDRVDSAALRHRLNLISH